LSVVDSQFSVSLINSKIFPGYFPVWVTGKGMPSSSAGRKHV
jgi:hypothetical protein